MWEGTRKRIGADSVNPENPMVYPCPATFTDATSSSTLNDINGLTETVPLDRAV